MMLPKNDQHDEGDEALNTLLNKNLIYNFLDPNGEQTYALTTEGYELVKYERIDKTNLTPTEKDILTTLFVCQYENGGKDNGRRNDY